MESRRFRSPMCAQRLQEPSLQASGKSGVLDPNGEQIQYGVPDLGFAGDGAISQSDPAADEGDEDHLVIIPSDKVKELHGGAARVSSRFRRVDDGGVFSAVRVDETARTVSGTLCAPDNEGDRVTPTTHTAGDDVHVAISPQVAESDLADEDESPEVKLACGHVWHNERWEKARVKVVPLESELFARARGIFETSALADKRVLVCGESSMGSHVTLGLAVLGIMWLTILDDDRLEAANVQRHVLGLSDLGRYKTKGMRSRILDKNPYAHVQTCEWKITWKTKESLRKLVQGSDLVICAIDDPEGRVILNRICVKEGKTLILAGVMRRAHDGQVLVVKPRQTPCYQCLLMSGPGKSSDQEVSSRQAASRVAYSDRPVPVEPGLSNDIAPINQIVLKLALQILLSGTDTTLRSLDEDLTASWYTRLNRRETGTCYERLGPIAYNVGGVRVMRWYGIAHERHPSCPVCGDFVGTAHTDLESLSVS